MNVYIDISNTILETERLILRPWRQEDLDDFFEYASVSLTSKVLGENKWKQRFMIICTKMQFIFGQKSL